MQALLTLLKFKKLLCLLCLPCLPCLLQYNKKGAISARAAMKGPMPGKQQKR